MYTWGLGYGYVLLNGEEDDETLPFKVKNKIINNHSIYELDAGNQHVLYTSYPDTIKEKVIIEPEAYIR
jgi:alpha-tubulin suppressor-like RCC1 family protein